MILQPTKNMPLKLLTKYFANFFKYNTVSFFTNGKAIYFWKFHRDFISAAFLKHRNLKFADLYPAKYFLHFIFCKIRILKVFLITFKAVNYRLLKWVRFLQGSHGFHRLSPLFVRAAPAFGFQKAPNIHNRRYFCYYFSRLRLIFQNCNYRLPK